MARPEGVADALPVTDFRGMVPDIAAAALRQVDEEAPELVDAPWRDRRTETALLELELNRRLEPDRRGPCFDEPELALFAAWFEALCRQGVALHTVQHMLRAAVARSFAELFARAQPDDLTSLLGTACRVAQYGALERLLVRVYRSRAVPAGDRALTTGLSRRGGAYLVVVLDRLVDDSEGLPARTLETVFDGRHHLLVPLTGDRAGTWQQVAGWVAARSGLRAAATVARSAADVPAAGAGARSILAAALAVRHPPGLAGPRDLAIEAMLLDDPALTVALASVLRPLEDEPRLLQTLLVFLARDLDRSRTAADVRLSRGGLALRLDRITRITGWDPRSVRGVQVLATAVSARALLHALDRTAT